MADKNAVVNVDEYREFGPSQNKEMEIFLMLQLNY